MIDAPDKGLPFDPVDNLYPPDPVPVVDEKVPAAATLPAESKPESKPEESKGLPDATEPEAVLEPPAEGKAPDVVEAEDGGETTSIEEFDFGGKDFKDLTANVIVDGQTKAVPLAEVLKSFQISEAGEKRLREADQIKDVARQTLTAQNEQWKTNLEILPQVAHLIAQEEVLELHRKSLDRIRQDDPAEYAARMLDINTAQATIDQHKQGFSAQIVARTQQTLAAQEQEHASLLQSEMQKLLAARPELSDKKQWAEFTTNVVDYAKGYGIPENDVRGVTNHSMLMILDKARKWDAAQGNITTTRKQPTAAPKALRPGAKSENKPVPKSDVEILYG